MELIKNYDTGVHPKEILGCPAFNDAEKDLYLHSNVPGDSCFVVANVTGDDGKRYNFLIHSGAMVPEGDPASGMMVSMVSLTDKERKEYMHDEKVYPMAECTFAPDHFDITSPMSSMKGSSSEFTVYGELPGGRGRIRAEMKNLGPTLNNCGTGQFLCMNDKVLFNEYGLPYLKTEGVLTLDGKEIRFTGDAWLDRQWGSAGVPLPLVIAQDKVQTKWMDLNLSNGYKVSLWDILAHEGKENSCATILTPEGVHIIAPMTPLAKYEEYYWYSEETGNYYATRYVVELPGLDTRIDVVVYDDIPQQEAVSASGYHRYEAHADCSGIFMGEEVTGFCCIELVGCHGQQLREGNQENETVPDDGIDPSVSGTYRGIMHSPIGDKDITFFYEVKDGSLNGYVTLLGKTSPVTEVKGSGNCFTHSFRMKPPMGIGSVNVTVKGKVEGNKLEIELKTPMGTLPIKCRKTLKFQVF